MTRQEMWQDIEQCLRLFHTRQRPNVNQLATFHAALTLLLKEAAGKNWPTVRNEIIAALQQEAQKEGQE